MRSLLVGLLLLLPATAFAKASYSVAVLPLAKGSGGAEYDGLGTALSGMLVTDLSGLTELQLVERQRLDDLLAEIKLGKTGFLDKRSTQKLGKGLGAQYIVMGSFSVVKDQFVMDTRIVSTETGAIVKAASSNGPANEFVAVEKDVIEKLLDGLQVKLSLAAKRKLLIQAPTEDFSALASYGLGLNAKKKGNIQEAKKAFAEAVKRDPDFALAATALAELATKTAALQQKERQRFKNNRQRSLHEALKKLPPETKRAKRFKHSQKTLLDFSIRQGLLRYSDQHCQRYQELKIFFLRTRGKFEPFYQNLAKKQRERWEAGEKMAVARAKALGIAGVEGTYFGRTGREVMRMATDGMSSGKRLLLSGNLSPEKFSSTLLASLIACHPPAVQVREWEQLQQKVASFGWVDEPLWVNHKGGPSKVTVRDSMALTWAWLRATHWGVDKKVTAKTERVLLRHPEGKKSRRKILSRIRDVVLAGEAFERHRAARHGMSVDELKGALRALIEAEAKVLHLDNELCQLFVDLSKRGADRTWEMYEKDKDSRNEHIRSTRIDQLGGDIAPLLLAGCYRTASKRPLTVKQILKQVDAGLSRRHPGTLKEASCEETIAEIRKSYFDKKTDVPLKQIAWKAHAALSRMYFLRVRRCLLP